MAADCRAAPVLDGRQVSHHAVARYCQRVLGAFIPDEEARKHSNPALADIYCRAADVTADAVCAIILTPAVIAMCEFTKKHARTTLGREGVFTVRTPEFSARIRNGVVVTVETEEVRKSARKLKHQTRSEMRRRIHQENRRRS